MPLKIKMQLVGWDLDDAGNKVIRDIKEQNIFFADVPIMIDIYEEGNRFKVGSLGTFLINGVDRVIVSQLHRSPGVVISQSKKVKDYRDRPYYLARIIPMRGSWIDFEFDSNDILYVRIDKKKKFLATTFLQALGYTREEILSLFYQFDAIHADKGSFYRLVNDSLIGMRIEKGMLDSHEKEFLGRRVTKETIQKLQKLGIKKLALKKTSLLNRVVGKEIVDPETGEIIIDQGDILTESRVEMLEKLGKISFDLIQSSGYVFQPTIGLTLAQDKCSTQDEALKELHAKVWPGDSAALKEIKERLENLLFNSRFYDLTRVGRIRINRKLGLDISEDTLALTKEDIVQTLRYLVNLRERGEGELDDIDHLGNRRVRLVGELLNNQMYVGFMRIERIVRERFRMQEAHSGLMPQDFLNVKPLSAVLREFFGLGQLSQFMDQTNPLSELAHKRRLSALGPGGVLKDRATFEVRDVHTSHYGRICPIETPEGQTVGLISSLATYAMVNDLGFIETAYRPVSKGKIQDAVVFLDAFQEGQDYIAQADAIKSGQNKLPKDVIARHEGNFMAVDSDRINYIDLSPKQLVSVSAALIPFLEHDDAVRALMGSNMQRQAVPLIKTEVPIVGTGMEKEIVKGSSAVLAARRAGVVTYVSSEKIVVQVNRDEFSSDDEWITQGVDTYQLKKFVRSSYSTWMHHTPIVNTGDKVAVGDILTNGQSINKGELALGSNLLVAFMPWLGYNFEDAIVLSKRVVYDDMLTSIHIEEFEVEARDTKLGPEEITRDIPNVSEAALSSLDEDGIIRIGTRVKAGDILVGKVTLKGDIQFSPEEKLLRAIFGEKSREVRDTSLRVSPGIEGTVTDVKIFSRSGARKDKRYKEEATRQIEKLEQNHSHHVELMQRMISEKIREELEGKETGAGLAKRLLSGSKFTAAQLEKLSFEELFSLNAKDKAISDHIAQLKKTYDNQLRILSILKEERINELKKGDPLPSGVIKVVKVYIAMKRTISVGDKIAGRHGNKGVVSTIVPREDMPYLWRRNCS
jgi:DNA-directed RNA polymerase beta subunit